MDKGMLGAFIGAFVIVVIGGALLTSVGDTQAQITQLNTVNNQTVALVNGTPFTLAQNQLTAVTSFYNASNASQPVQTGNYTIDLQQGIVTLLNGRTGSYNISYTWYEVGDGTSRTLSGFYTLFFALAVLLAVVAYMWPKIKDWADL